MAGHALHHALLQTRQVQPSQPFHLHWSAAMSVISVIKKTVVQVSLWTVLHKASDTAQGTPVPPPSPSARPLSTLERAIPKAAVPYAQLMRLHAPIGECQ